MYQVEHVITQVSPILLMTVMMFDLATVFCLIIHQCNLSLIETIKKVILHRFEYGK